MIICSDSMDSDAELQAEAAILERMVYESKNQHRRGSYFQHLTKVRRDLRLLQSTKLEELFGCCFQSITGNRPKQKLHLLQSLLKLWFVPDDETICETADANHSAEKGPVEVKEDKINLMSGLCNDGDNRQLVEHCEDGSTVGETPSMKFSEEGCLLTGTSSSSSSDASKLKSGPVKVAFIQVKTPSQSNKTEIPSK
ncbi:hypothetical protein D8674_022284 [Pyrus ussuriensis x Pyrus communis]|uniref:Nucleolus and neural progenitor protein-like N-terminal domain-containing protein n=1 Tax=Pyrus ussuriensis x Pyrus communis TaxID=2448454 RepID=A0A5N5GJG1_9ROSA|nr:hypothetical protein D8674_022284 [Pyrus ussuriensis x Pyrus communis]